MSDRCGAAHPEIEVTCRAKGDHADHISGQHVWPNTEWQEAQPRKVAYRDRKEALSVAREAARRTTLERPIGPHDVRVATRTAQEEGMARAFGAAEDDFKEEARRAIRDVARTHAEFTTDDVWAVLAERGITTEHRLSMGTLMRAAARGGLVENTKRMTKTERSDQRSHGLIVWRSMIFS